MLCDTAVELVRELQRDSWLPPRVSSLVDPNSGVCIDIASAHPVSFAAVGVGKPSREGNFGSNRASFPLSHPLFASDPSPAGMCRMACLERNKRCVMAYHKHRAEEIMRVRWECGTSVMQQELQERLSAQELQLSNDYDRLLSNYMINIGAPMFCKQPYLVERKPDNLRLR
eukprot:294220-Rhodomonas_salina.5